MSGRQILPVASAAQVRSYARRLTLRHPRELAVTLAMYGTAAACGLIGPRLLGDLVGRVQGRSADMAYVDETALAIAVFVVGQAVLTRFAVYLSAKLGEKVLAQLRQEFVASILALPLATVERAGMGDLVTRSTRDVDALSRSVRRAVPETLIAIVTGLVAIGALVLVGPLLALPCLTAVPLLWGGTRWYLARARDGYLRENASWAEVTASLAETVEGARTIEAFGLQHRRNLRGDADIATCYAAERYTLKLRTVWFPLVETGYVLPIAATLLIGGLYYINGLADLAQVTAATLYVQQLIDPVDRLLSWIDELQVGGASLARLLGVADTSEEPRTSARRPDGEAVTVEDVRFAYRTGHDVLHGVDLRLRPGERLAIVGPSGAGKSTLGRLIAGIMPPGSGSVQVGGVPLTDLPLEDLRGHVALVTQEHHVFLGTIADNLRLARPDAPAADLADALRAVDAWPWVSTLPNGLDTQVGSLEAHSRDGADGSDATGDATADDGAVGAGGEGGAVGAVGLVGEPGSVGLAGSTGSAGLPASAGWPGSVGAVGVGEAGEAGVRAKVRVKLSPAQAQQLSLARVILADPHTLVLDEATSLLDPRAARHLERSLAAILEGRTVVAIAHRLQTAHDADRVAVVEDGRITELGSHEELIDAGGSYSALWRSWHGG